MRHLPRLCRAFGPHHLADARNASGSHWLADCRPARAADYRNLRRVSREIAIAACSAPCFHWPLGISFARIVDQLCGSRMLWFSKPLGQGPSATESCGKVTGNVPELAKIFLDYTPLGRTGKSEDIAGPAIFLASVALAHLF